MSVSQNGWVASPSPSVIHVERFRVPRIEPAIFLTVRREVAPILLNVARRYHRRVDELDNKLHDDGGYNYRTIAGSSVLSNHASGTAIDLNWSKYPRGQRRMTFRQREACRAIVDRFEVIRWGGDWPGAMIDEMHFEIAPGVSLTDVRRVVRKLGLKVS